ncbi:MAG TPA: OmpA family protein [Aestuariivirga sp.]|nr:OmpA family protein [Aestuariivirga sp.]
MKFLPLTASLMALALFSAPAFAQEQPPAAVEEAASQIPEEVLILLNDTRPLSELTVEELGARAKQARQFSKMKGLPPETSDKLQAMAHAARGEIAAREQQAAQPEAPATEQPAAPATAEQPAVEAPAVVEQPAVEAPAVAEQPAVEAPAEDAAPAAVELPPDVANLLNDQRPLTELSAEELDHRFKTARQFSKAKKLPEETKAQLAGIAKAAREELMARETAAQKVPEPQVQPETAAQPPAAEQPAVVEQPPIVEQPPVAETQPPAAAAPVDAKQTQQLDGNAAVPEAEAKAKVYLEDPTPADKLSDEDLRKRLDGIRELMAGNELSRKTEQALRKKLRVERDILRNRVALAEPPKPVQPEAGAPPAPKPSKISKRDYTFNIDIVLNDRRPSDELQDYELRRRLEVYRQYDRDERYDEDQRAYWREVRRRDEALLQQRLIRERRQRQAELASQNDNQYDIELEEGYDPDQRDDVYAAEVDDEELEDVLVSAPRRKFDRRYTVEEVEASPDLREALPRIEIDTVRFGFNEAFVRPEEVGNLDRIGEIMERVLSKHPRERFLIEGHTDAVGSDASNLNLSRQRAAAIKKALTTYYVISPENLETVGYGERYLKIPTAEAEQENRRVSVSRATSVFGELEE